MKIEKLGPYLIGRQLGKGGMGSVYEAIEERSRQKVAVKALAPQLASAEGFRERFEAEIDSLKKLQHEGIVRLYGYGEDGGNLFYSMELVDGASLEAEINSGRRFDWRQTLSIAIQVCRALKHAHDHGVVHRDIKPANLLLTGDGKVKIADFGIARLFGSNQLTTAGGVLGTADYMSPEQADGRPVTDKCDQYSLGCVMYALLTGRPPFRAKTMPEMLQLQRFAEPEPVRRYSPQTPEELERLIGQLLSKEPSARFPNVMVLARHMEAMEKGLSRGPKPAPAEEPRAKTIVPDDPEATMAAEDLEELELSDSGYDGPTLADEGQLAAVLPTASLRSAATSAAAVGTVAPPVRTRFTTVDEETQRQEEQAQAERRILALQLAGLLAALAVLAWIGWKLTRPPSADALYRQIVEAVERDGNAGLVAEASAIDSFLERFPNDSRAGEVDKIQDNVELLRLERQLMAQARWSTKGEDSHVAEVYLRAVALQDSDPARAAEILHDLLDLYKPAGAAPDKLSDEDGRFLTLAERQLAKLEGQASDQAASQLPALRERLRTARSIEAARPEQAAAMYSALIDLEADRSWAAPVVDEAKERLQELGERGKK